MQLSISRDIKKSMNGHAALNVRKGFFMDLKVLCLDLIQAKKDEETAKKRRIHLEEILAGEFPAPAGTEGTTTRAIDGFKIIVSRKLTRSLDHEAYLSLRLPDPDKFVDYVPKIRLPAYRKFEANWPEIAAQCVTTKPAKTAVKVEVVE